MSFSLSIETTGSHVPCKSLDQAHATFMPDAIWTVSRSPSRLIPGHSIFPGFDIIHSLSTRHQWFTRVRLLGPHLTRVSLPFPSTLTTRALYPRSLRRFETCSCKPVPRGPPSSLAQHRTPYRSLGCAFMAHTEPKTHTSRCDDANENNSGSSRRDPPNGSWRSTPPSTTLSTSNAIFYPAASSRRFEPRRSRSGIKVGLPPELDHDPIVATATVNVMEWTPPVAASDAPEWSRCSLQTKGDVHDRDYDDWLGLGQDRADSIGRRNSFGFNSSKILVQGLGGCLPIQRLSRPHVKCQGDCLDFVCAVGAEVGSFREVLA